MILSLSVFFSLRYMFKSIYLFRFDEKSVDRIYPLSVKKSVHC
jgi:hypothetical protein